MFILHIYLTLPVAMVTENDRQYGLNRENAILDHNLEVSQTVFLNLDNSTAKYQKYILIFFFYFFTINHSFKYIFGICLCSIIC